VLAWLISFNLGSSSNNGTYPVESQSIGISYASHAPEPCSHFHATGLARTPDREVFRHESSSTAVCNRHEQCQARRRTWPWLAVCCQDHRVTIRYHGSYLNPAHVVGREVKVSKIFAFVLRQRIVLFALQQLVHWYLLIREFPDEVLVLG
jgi:hypothetical protein